MRDAVLQRRCAVARHDRLRPPPDRHRTAPHRAGGREVAILTVVCGVAAAAAMVWLGAEYPDSKGL